jgi:hypothetical protein
MRQGRQWDMMADTQRLKRRNVLGQMASRRGLGRELSGMDLSRLEEGDAVEIEDQMTWECCRFARSI